MAAPRITGKLAALYLDVTGSIALAEAVKVADIFDWTLEAQAEVFECSVKEESYDRYESGGANARLTAQRYLTSTTADRLNKEVLAAVRVGGTAGKRIAWKLIPVNASAEEAATTTPTGVRYAFGFGWVTRGSLTAPRGMMVDSLEIQIDGEWQYSDTA